MNMSPCSVHEPFMNTSSYSVHEVRGCKKPFKNTSPYSVHEVRGSWESLKNTSPYSVHEPFMNTSSYNVLKGELGAIHENVTIQCT